MERIKNHQKMVDNTYQRVMRQLQTPMGSAVKRPVQHSVHKRDMATSISAVKDLASSNKHNRKGRPNQVDAETSPFMVATVETQLELITIEHLSLEKTSSKKVARGKENSGVGDGIVPTLLEGSSTKLNSKQLASPALNSLESPAKRAFSLANLTRETASSKQRCSLRKQLFPAKDAASVDRSAKSKSSSKQGK